MHALIKKLLSAAFILSVGVVSLFASGSVRFQKTYPVSEVNGVRLALMSESVEIALWNRNEFRVTVVSEYGDYPVPELTGGVLSCEDKSGGSRHSCLIEIKVPESFYAKAAYGGWNISTMSGSINASKLWGDCIDIESMSGSISLSRCESQMADIESMSGRVSLSECIISGMTQIQSTSGSVTFDGITAGINIETTSGSISISLDRPLTEDCTLESGTGSITVAMVENPGFKFVFDTATGSVYNAFTGYSGGKSGIDNYGAGYVIINAESGTGSIRILRK